MVRIDPVGDRDRPCNEDPLFGWFMASLEKRLKLECRNNIGRTIFCSTTVVFRQDFRLPIFPLRPHIPSRKGPTCQLTLSHLVGPEPERRQHQHRRLPWGGQGSGRFQQKSSSEGRAERLLDLLLELSKTAGVYEDTGRPGIAAIDREARYGH